MHPAGSVIGAWVLLPFIAGGCASTSGVPDALKKQIDEALTFEVLKQTPGKYKGHIIVLGGEVLAAKRLKQGTRVEVLQLPLDWDKKPATDLLKSRGRFLALQSDFLDPATLPAGTQVTIVGKVIGETTLPLDETEYTYPTVTIKNLRVWPKEEPYSYWHTHPYVGPHYGPYWYPYWAPWRRYPYWW